MILEMTCTSIKRSNDNSNYYYVVFKAGPCEVKISVKENIAQNYEIGKLYDIKISKGIKEVVA